MADIRARLHDLAAELHYAIGQHPEVSPLPGEGPREHGQRLATLDTSDYPTVLREAVAEWVRVQDRLAEE